MGRFSVLFLVLVVGGAGLLAADDLPEDPVSDALMAKYQPLMEEFQTAFEAGDYAGALPRILSIRTGVEKDLTPVHSAVLQINMGVATVYAKLKKAKEAEAVLSDLQKRLVQKKLTDSPKALFVWEGTRDLEGELGNAAKAKEADTQVKALLKKHPDWKKGNNEAEQKKKEGADQAQNEFQGRFGEVYQAFGNDPARALDLARALAADAAGKFGPDSPIALQAGRVLAMALGNSGQETEADAELARIQGLLERQGPSFDLLLVLDDRAQAARRQGGDPSPFDKKVADLTAKDKNLAAQWKMERDKQDRKAKDEGDRKPEGPGASGDFPRQLAKADQMAKEGKPQEAQNILTTIRDQARGSLPPGDPLFGEIDRRLQDLAPIVGASKDQGPWGPSVQKGIDLLARADQASDPDLYRQAVALLDFDPQPRRDQALGLARWAKLVLARGDADRAEVLLLKSLEVLGRLTPGRDADRAAVAGQLADLYRSTGNGPAEKEARTVEAQARP